jgi:Zn-dependent protease with chaperone function
MVFTVLATMFLFLAFYFGLILACLAAIYFLISFSANSPVRVRILFVAVFSVIPTLVLLFLMKGLFRFLRPNKEPYVEITKEEQPRLFRFLERLCEEIGTTFPRRVYVSYEVNACVFYESSLLNLLLPTPKNLLIGLGIVNVVPLHEFKAVLAHEFGHFSQSSMKLGVYVYTIQNIIRGVIEDRDWFDDLLYDFASINLYTYALTYPFFALAWLIRQVLAWIYYLVNFSLVSLSREMEFHADLVAVSSAGSDAISHLLHRLTPASEAMQMSLEALHFARDKQLFTRDLLYHHQKSLLHLRTVKRDPQYGLPPELPRNPKKIVYLFGAKDNRTPPMWAHHPNNYDREVNAKQHYIRSPIDDRSAWLLFDDVEELSFKVTKKVYRHLLKVRNKVKYSDPQAVQTFIDEERSETTYDHRYHGIYDQRGLVLEGLSDAIREVESKPLSASKLQSSLENLFDDSLADWADEYRERLDELHRLFQLLTGAEGAEGGKFKFRKKTYSVSELPKLIKRMKKELKKDDDYLEKLDRKVFKLHYQMAKEQGGERANLLRARYSFQLHVQHIQKGCQEEIPKIVETIQYVQSENLTAVRVEQAAIELSASWSVVRESLDTAKLLTLPPLKNMTEGEPLSNALLKKDFISQPTAQALMYFDEDAEPPVVVFQGKLIQRLIEQVSEIEGNARRIAAKSLGVILGIQEEIEKDWLAANAGKI